MQKNRHPVLPLAATSAAAVILTACSTTPQTTPVTTQTLTADPDYKLYALKCATCHQPYPPHKFPLAEWPEILQNMALKARLTAPEQQTITQFIQRHAQ